MTIGQEFWGELKLEAEVTRRYLESFLFDKKEFKTAEKSETLGRLVIHVAEIVGWWATCINQEKLNFIDLESKEINTVSKLLSYFDRLLNEAKEALMNVKGENLVEDWSMTYGEEVLLTQPEKQVLRLFCMNHLVYHLAQVGVYLRMLGITVPAVYRLSADDKNVTLINQYDYE